MARSCECADPQCPLHIGNSSCPNRANTILYRVDMQDETGTDMCNSCAEDAYHSGLFTGTSGETGDDDCEVD